MHQAKHKLISTWRLASQTFTWLVIAIGLLGLGGWMLDLPVIKHGFSDGATIKVNAAIAFILLGVSTLLLFYKKIIISRLLLVAVSFVCLSTLYEHIFSIDLGIDDWLLSYASSKYAETIPIRLPVFSTVCFLLLTITIFIITLDWIGAAQILAGLLFIVTYASLIGNIYGINGLAFQADYNNVANLVILGFCFQSLALLTYCPSKGWLKLLSSRFAGGTLARYTFGYFLLVSPIFIGFYLFTLNRWHLPPGLSILSLFLLTCLITLPLTYFYLQRLNAFDAHLQKAHARLQNAHDKAQSRNVELQQGNRELALMAQEVIKSSLDMETKNKELLRINQGLEFIVQMTSHDLKTPIYNIEILFEDLRPALETILNGEVKVVHLMANSISSLKRTIDGLAQIIRSQQTIIGLQVNVSISRLMEEIQQELDRDIQACNAKIKVLNEVDVIVFSQIHLRSVLFNLLSNSIKYRSPQRQLVVTIGTKKVEGGVEIHFSDNGLGMNPKQLSQLFTIFKRFHSHVEGSGIGLYIVKATIENNGGRIEADSTEGVGTQFTIFLPQSF
ncbi:sensor histidine kinase [Adhaeribacter aquaticus]|uniref:sensor histidine kinase n=1 Tax=Adhaeribacter aquaticus TaxID=299567 RepID=UPI000426A344|nr:ATP-binding protein [Adhaeribacter aquaticus]